MTASKAISLILATVADGAGKLGMASDCGGPNCRFFVQATDIGSDIRNTTLVPYPPAGAAL